ncbi:hypothetical protein [Deinococcus sp.]|uniref:hypothetical protein n=1 Tax=Deinococcus sp. TaxID=47478 RepID=UPI0025F68C6E|nr:hypothetical protein [Deinococcus sp.]
MSELLSRGVPTFTGSSPEVYLERAFTDAGLGPSQRLSVARELGETSLMWQVHPTLGRAEMNAVADQILEVLTLATH